MAPLGNRALEQGLKWGPWAGPEGPPEGPPGKANIGSQTAIARDLAPGGPWPGASRGLFGASGRAYLGPVLGRPWPGLAPDPL